MLTQRYIWLSILCTGALCNASEATQRTGFSQLPSVLIEYIATFNTTATMTDHEVASWHEFMLINKECLTVSTQLIQKTLSSLTTGKEYELFKQTMHIYKLAQTLAGKPKLPYEALRKQVINTHYPRLIQTRTGLYVTCDTYPSALHTPWGIIDLPQKDSWGAAHVTEILHTFLSRVVTTFYSIALPTKFYGTDVHYYRTDLTTWRVGDQRYDPAKRIARCDITTYKGQHVFIEGNLYGSGPTLMVCSVNGAPVEAAMYRCYSAARHRALTNKIFNMLLTHYQQEQREI